MAPHVLQLIHGGSVVKSFLKQIWRVFSAKLALPKRWAEDEYQGSDIHMDNW